MKTYIIIDGVMLNDFSHLSLTQRIYEHHSFEIVIGHEVIEMLGGHTLDLSKNWIGKSAIIKLGEYDFVGLVTNVEMVHNHGMFGDLVIRGYSPTILLESGSHLFSWTDQSLKDILVEVCARGSGLKSTIKPEYVGEVGYISQHRESNYAFLKRVACQYNEWMYYDGEKFFFGKPDELPTVSMAYGTDMDHVMVSVGMKPVKMKGFSYHSTNNENIEGQTADSVSGLDEIGSHGFTASTENFNFTPTVSMGPRIPDKGSLDDALEKMQNAAAADLSKISGSSSKQELRPGVIADIKANIYDFGIWASKPYGEYLITAVHHHATGDNVYSNHFEGIPAGVKVLPEPHMPMPVAYPQIATVMTNNDPKQKGRIQVQFQWQVAEGLNTNWIRVMTPDAGSSDKVSTNRGFVAIPEVGDQVMVGYRYGDPSRPFVMGSLFHGQVGGGGTSANKMKSLTTRSGNTIVMNDDEGKGSIKVSDPSGNTITLHGNGSMTITAPNTMTFNATDIVMNAGNSFTLNAKPSEEGSGEGIVTVTAEKSITCTATNEDIILTAESKDVSITADAGKLVTSSSEIDMTGTSSAVISSSDTNIM